MALDEILRNFPIKWLGVIVRHSIFPLGLSLRQPNDFLSHRVASLVIRPGAARDRLTAGIYNSDDPKDITGCLEDALHKVIKAEPIERRLRHEQVIQHGLEDYQQWVNRLQESGQVSVEEADILLQARAATTTVVMVDDFTTEQMTNKMDVPKKTATKKKATPKKSVKKKSVNKEMAVKKKRVRGSA